MSRQSELMAKERFSRRTARKWEFRLTDRVKIDREYYIWIGYEGGFHHFKKVVEGIESEISFLKTNDDLTRLAASSRIRIDERYFSENTQLRLAKYGTLLSFDHLSETDQRTIRWKTMWCERFRVLHDDAKSSTRPRLSKASLADFIETQKESLHDDYRKLFSESRPLGRSSAGGIKSFDFPSATTLYEWVKRFREFDYTEKAFVPLYRTKCGRRDQIHPMVREVLEKVVPTYASVSRPTIFEIFERVNAQLQARSEDEGMTKALTVSRNTVNRRVKALDALFKEAGRHGADRALRRFSAVGEGISVKAPLERVEIDDWTMDLHTVLASTAEWKALSKAQRAKVPRVRCTVTVAIDVYTRCIVGLAVSDELPSGGGAVACLHSMLTDKSYQAERVGCQSDWISSGRAQTVATDGGPVFQTEFRETLRLASIEYSSPETDPRKRGTIESAFRYFKRLCSYFAGRTFASVLEKGEYDSEKSASVTVDEIRDLITLFVVDFYHHRGHRGLSNATPYNMWVKCAPKQNLPDRIELAKIFGFPDTARLDKHGITYQRLSYNCDLLSVLMEKVGESPVRIRVYPFDMSFIQVLIPPPYVTSPEFEGDEFIVVPLVQGTNRPLTLKEVKARWGEVNARNKDEAQTSNRIRFYTITRLMREGEEARKRAGLGRIEFSADDYGTLRRRKSHANEEAAFNSRLRAAFEASKSFEEPEEQEFEAADEAPEVPAAVKRPAKAKPSRADRTPRPPRRSITGFEGDGV